MLPAAPGTSQPVIMRTLIRPELSKYGPRPGPRPGQVFHPPKNTVTVVGAALL